MAGKSGAKARRARRAREARKAEQLRLAAKRRGADAQDSSGRRERLWLAARLAVILLPVAGCAALASAKPFARGWLDLASEWPGEGYGLAAAAGFVLLPCTVGVVSGVARLCDGALERRRCRSAGRAPAVGGRLLLTAACGLLGLLGVTAMSALLTGGPDALPGSASVMLQRAYPFAGLAAVGGFLLSLPALWLAGKVHRPVRLLWRGPRDGVP